MWALEERITWLFKGRFEKANEVVIQEKNQLGEACVRLTSSEPLICLNSPRDDALYFLQERKLADGIVLQVSETGAVLHLIECKKVIKDGNWEHIKSQWSGALQTALALCGVLGLTVSENQRVFLYSAYREDKLSPSNNTNPALLKMLTGARSSDPIPPALEWGRQNVKILGCQFRHHKIQLDPAGHGHFQIEVNE